MHGICFKKKHQKNYPTQKIFSKTKDFFYYFRVWLNSCNSKIEIKAFENGKF